MENYRRENVLTSEERERDDALPLLQVDRVSYWYPQFSLKEISFDLREGEFLTVAGSNGSGKSTLLKLVSGFLSPTSGRICLNGREVRDLSLAERARQIALVMQESPLNFPLTVEEFVLQGRHPHLGWLRLERSNDRDLARWAMRATNCEEFALRKMQELSGGERQRVVLARALAQQPRLLLLDEPTLNLDLGYQMELVHLLKSLSQANHFTVMMVTHELNLAAEFSDQVLLLHRGQSLAWGTPETVFEEKSLMEVFNLDVLVDRNPISGRPRITPVNHRSRLFDPNS